MNMLRKRLESLKNPSEDELGLLAAYDEPFDCTAKENIAPLAAHVRTILNG